METKVVIIEDEKIAADYLEKMIREFSAEFTIIKKLDSVEASVAYLQNNLADLLFVDIHLADDISFTIFEQLELKTPVIFTTAYDQYAIRAFKLNSIDYLLKPIDENDLHAALRKFQELRTQGLSDIKQLIAHFNDAKNSYQSRFLVSSGQKLRSIAIDEIAYFYSEQKHSFLATSDGKQYILDNSLDKIESLLDPSQFFRINRQFIVGFSSIKNMLSYSKSRVKLELYPSTEKDTIVSVERSSEFKIWLNK